MLFRSVPEARAGRVVLNLLRFAEAGLAALGVRKVYYHVKRERDFGRLLERLAYRDSERMYAKVLNSQQDGAR